MKAELNINSIKNLGQVSTPDSIVNFMLDIIGYKGENILNKHVLDNSCGDGAFLKSIVKRYVEVAKEKKLSATEIKKGLETYIHGVEIEVNSYKKLNTNGKLIYITPSFFKNASSKILREKIYQEKKLVHIYNFKHQQVFPNITTYPVISLFDNSQKSQKFSYSVVELKNNHQE